MRLSTSSLSTSLKDSNFFEINIFVNIIFRLSVDRDFGSSAICYEFNFVQVHFLTQFYTAQMGVVRIFASPPVLLASSTISSANLR